MSEAKTIDVFQKMLTAVRGDLMPEAYLAPGGPFWCDDYVTATAAADVHAALAAVRRDSIPSTARGAALERWASVIEVPRKGATPARKSSALQIKGTEGAIVRIGEELQARRGGALIQVNQEAKIPAEGVMRVDVMSIDLGPGARFEAGAEFEFVNPPDGVSQSAKLLTAMDEGGLAQESEGSHQARVARHFSDPPQGGNADDYAKKGLEFADIDAAYVYPLRGGVGTVHMACLHAGSGTARLLNEAERQSLQDHIDAWRPIGAQFLALRVAVEPVDIELTIAARAEPRYRWDWDDSQAPVVASYDPNTRELVFADALPDTLQPKHRLCVASASGDDDASGTFVTVAAISGPDRVILAPDSARPDNLLGFVPVAGDVIYAGSDVVVAVREALLNGYVVDGIRVPGLNQLGTANPGHIYGSWLGSVDPNRLQGHAFASHRGVARAQTLAPTSIIDASDPAYPDNHTIGLCIPRQVIVRRMGI